MPKTIIDSILDAAIDVFDQCNGMHLCSDEPTTRTEAVTTYQLASAVMTPDTDFTKADGGTSGRKVTTAVKNGVIVDVSGTGNHIAFTDASDLLHVTTCTGQAVVANGTNVVNFPAYVLEFRDPT